jgi:hypothetical protein
MKLFNILSITPQRRSVRPSLSHQKTCYRQEIDASTSEKIPCN